MAEPQGLEAWNERGAPGRISPRQCVANARDELNMAWGSTAPQNPVPYLIGAIDWMRRALEQMAPTEENE